MYSAAFLQHFEHPRGQGRLADATHSACVDDAACGDELELDLRVEDGRIDDARFRVRGCPGAIAVGSALATLLPGRPAAPDAVSRAELDEALGSVPATKRHALRLGVNALAAALAAAVP
jgi:nitrogen fixation NifU-like protein